MKRGFWFDGSGGEGFIGEGEGGSRALMGRARGRRCIRWEDAWGWDEGSLVRMAIFHLAEGLVERVVDISTLRQEHDGIFGLPFASARIWRSAPASVSIAVQYRTAFSKPPFALDQPYQKDGHTIPLIIHVPTPAFHLPDLPGISGGERVRMGSGKQRRGKRGELIPPRIRATPRTTPAGLRQVVPD